MPLVPMRAILEATEKYNYAQGAFNVNAVAQAKAVIEVHEMFRSAAIIQGADLANAFMGGRTDFANGTLEDKKIGANNIANAVKKYGENSRIPVARHLDHGKSIEACLAAMDGGYTSVMIDGSHLPFPVKTRSKQLHLCLTVAFSHGLNRICHFSVTILLFHTINILN